MDRNMTTPAKIEPWMMEAVKEMMVKHLGFGASVGTNWMLLESDLVAIVARHAPQEPPEWEAKEKALRELADRWMDEMESMTTPMRHQSLICQEHAVYLRAILNTPAAGGK